ncbi:hypothetical protein M3P19_15855 [Muricauda sp. 2012CJ35-5]|uniref:Uncharacterized protein n=1 Tax=Flagellimonas spongiicola TaxID=2942208 RepID=A0ABT0PVS2_9FLAO|nr:hypothetical protein [Allomuricauda spongiicola]MCL6275489.1 hypothetical protein [Allomuricauda spongiicola]
MRKLIFSTPMLCIIMIVLFLSCKEKNTESTNDTESDTIEIKGQQEQEDDVQNPTTGMGPNISPDGKKVVFYSYVDENKGYIFSMNIDGSGKKMISKQIPTGFHTEPVWSPDGTKIAFTNFTPDSGAKVLVMDKDGNNWQNPVSVSDKGFHMFGDWEPDSKNFYFFHWPEGGFTPDVYYYENGTVNRITNDGISCRPHLGGDGTLFFSKIVDEEKRIYDTYKVIGSVKNDKISTQKMDDLEGDFFTDKYALKTKDVGDSTVFVLEDLDGNDLREVGSVPHKGIMFPKLDKDLKNIIYNTSFEEGPEVHLLNLETNTITKLVAESETKS